MTIKQLREKEAERLAARKNANPTQEDLEKARHTMRLFYIFASAYKNSFYTEQNRKATQRQKDEADERSNKTYKKAVDALKAYNLKISLPGLDPIIEETSGQNWSYCHYYR